MGCGASTRPEEKYAAPPQDPTLAEPPRDQTLAEVLRDHTLAEYLGGSGNVLHLPVPAERDAALRVLRGEVARGELEFFCGSGVGRDLTGVDWVGLVNLGAERLLQAPGATEASPLKKDLKIFQLCQLGNLGKLMC